MTDKKLAHIVLQTTQLQPMRDWYLNVLEAHVVYENPMISFMTFDEEHHRLAIAQLPGLTERTPATVGLSHSAYTFDSLEDLLGRYEQLKSEGIEPRVPVQHGVTTSLYYRDPDGNLVELQVDNFATPEEATDYMGGQEYNSDPIGPTFDPEAMLVSFRDGVSPADLVTRAWAQRSPQLDVPALMFT